MDVGVFVVDGAADFGLAAVIEVLGTANALRADLDAPPPPWTVTMLGSADHVRTGAGAIVPARVVGRLTERPDLLIVPATNVKEIAGLIATVTSEVNAPALALIRDALDRGVPLASACTGTFFLAEAGALDGRTATTSWWLGPEFRRRYPRVDLDESRTVCCSDGITTAGAAIAHVDMALAIVRAQSPTLAERVAHVLLAGNRRTQSAFVLPSVLAHSDPVLAAFEQWARRHLAGNVRIAAAAKELGVSERSLQRTTAAALGQSPLEFVTALRIEHATHLLRTTSLTLDAVAARVGYVNGRTLRDVVRRRRGVSIRELRTGLVPEPEDQRPRRVG